MSEEKAVIVNRYIFIPQPSYGLADILDCLADCGDHHVIRLCISKLLRHVGTDM
jgi:hypothetical protein